MANKNYNTIPSSDFFTSRDGYEWLYFLWCRGEFDIVKFLEYIGKESAESEIKKYHAR